MQMIDLMKRLAELDSKNPTIVKETEGTVSCSSCGEKFKIAGRKDGFSHCKDHAGKKALDESADLAECGPMGMTDAMSMDRPSTPASINVTAGSGEELGNVLKDIMSLAGVKQVGAEEPLSAEPEPVMAIDVEPEQDMDPNSSMRSVMDLMNEPVVGDEGGEEIDDVDGLDRDHDGDHDMGDHELEKDDEEADEGQYDNSPANPIKPPMFNANQYAHQENQPGQGDRMDGDRPKAYADMNEATRALFAEYKKFVSEAYNPNSAGMMENMNRISEDLQADDGEYYKNSDEFFSQFDADTFDKEVTSPDGMEVKGYIDGKCVMAWRFKSAKKIGGYGIFDDSALGMDNDMMESEDLDIGQQMAKDGITYSREKENEIIDLMAEYMKKAGMSSKSINRLINYDQDYVPDQLSYLPRVKDQESQVSEISNSLNRAVHMKRHDNALAANMDMHNSRAGIAAIPYDKAVKQHDIEKAKYKKNIELNKIRNANQATARRAADHERIATGTNEVKK